MTRPLVPVAAAVATALLLTACSAEDDTTADPTPAPTTYTASPLGDAVPLLSLGEAEQAEIDREAARLIAVCLKEQGFDYELPYVADEPVVDAETDPRDWAAQYGYGLSTLTVVEPAESATDRSVAEQTAYDLALYGTGSDEGGYDWEREGCLGSAYHQATQGADEVMRDERFVALFAAVEAAQAEVDGSDAVLALQAEWADCMADAQFPELASPAAARASIQARLTDTVDLTALRTQEVALAVADIDCRASTSYDQRYNQVLWAAQAVVADEIADEIAALTAG